MTYLVITPDGALHLRNLVPTIVRIRGEVGAPGFDQVRLHGTVRGFVNDEGHVNGLPRNVVGTCLLVVLGAGWQPYAGPVVITGWHPHCEIVSLDDRQVEAIRTVHADIRGVLHGGPVSEHAPAEWQDGIRDTARIASARPTLTAHPDSGG